VTTLPFRKKSKVKKSEKSDKEMTMDEEKRIPEEKISKTITTLATMLDYLGLNAEVKAEEKNGRIIVKASSDDAGRIIGRKGQTLESLQFLINRMMLKMDNEFPRIYIDVDGYSKDGRGERSDERRRDESSYRPREKFSSHEDDSSSRRNDDERDAILAQQALDAAKEVKRWGEPVSLPPMNSHERRIIHTTLEGDKAITTESQETDNPNLKKVVIKPLSS
jgi:spoIIIJ-associated protein